MPILILNFECHLYRYVHRLFVVQVMKFQIIYRHMYVHNNFSIMF